LPVPNEVCGPTVEIFHRFLGLDGGLTVGSASNGDAEGVAQVTLAATLI
jgi:hypothetical protein